MSDFDRDARAHFGSVPRSGALEIDQGLRTYMLKVYQFMAIGLAVTGAAAYGTFSAAVVDGHLTGFGQAIFFSPLRWAVIFAPLLGIFVLQAGINRLSAGGAQLAFYVYSALMGLSLSSIFLVYTQTSITQVFFITAAAFASLSLYGYTTRRDLSAFASFLVMGLFGIIIASLVNMFLQSSALQFAVSICGVVIFAGLTAWDTQQIKEMYYAGDGYDLAVRKAVHGALRLYLDFINLFMMLLQLLGNRRS